MMKKNKISFFATLLLAVCITLVLSAHKKKLNANFNLGSELKAIVLDAGHGGHDPGCNGANEIWEKTVTLSITLKVGKLIEDSLKDVKVIYTRKSDKFVELWERPNIANKEKANLFISIHCNSNVNTTPAGSETYFMGMHKNQGNLDVAKRENSAILKESNYKNNEKYGGFDPNSPESHIIFSLYQNAYLKQAMKFSQLVENNTTKISKIKTRGIKQAGFLVLWQTAMPSVLIETGFLTNKNDRDVLKTEEGQKTIALGIYKAIAQYKRELEKNKSNIAKPKTTTDSSSVKN